MMLVALEHVSHMFGVHMQAGELWWSAAGGMESEYIQLWGENTYTLRCGRDKAEGMINGMPVVSVEKDFRVITDLAGNAIKTIAIV